MVATRKEITEMSSPMPLELNQEQRDVLLRGLRFVRSAAMLTPEDPTERSVAKRNAELQKISELASLLDGMPPAQETTV